MAHHDRKEMVKKRIKAFKGKRLLESLTQNLSSTLNTTSGKIMKTEKLKESKSLRTKRKMVKVKIWD